MKNLKISIAMLTLIGLVFAACKKSSPNQQEPKSNTELIVEAGWKFDNATSNGVDVSSILQTCEKDNVYTFASAGSGSVDEGATKCNAGDPQTSPFTWNFATNETVLHVSTSLFPGGSSDFSLVTLSESQLVVSQSVLIGGSSQNVVATFKH
jgi:hypothetical protein